MILCADIVLSCNQIIPDRLWNPPSHLFNRYRETFAGSKAAWTPPCLVLRIRIRAYGSIPLLLNTYISTGKLCRPCCTVTFKRTHFQIALGNFSADTNNRSVHILPVTVCFIISFRWPGVCFIVKLVRRFNLALHYYTLLNCSECLVQHNTTGSC